MVYICSNCGLEICDSAFQTSIVCVHSAQTWCKKSS